MAATDFDPDAIGPDVTPADVPLPPHVGERLATLYDREGRFETAAEWLAATEQVVASATGGAATEGDLCRVDDGAHEVEVDGERAAFVCVLDPLVVPFLRERPATIRSESRVGGDPVVVEVASDGVGVRPDDAVVSLGAADDFDEDAPLTPERIYREACPYVHAFASPAEYETWAADAPAATTSVPMATGVALARGIADRLFE